jgi:hypothetical protein
MSNAPLIANAREHHPVTRAQWEARQALPLLATLVVAGVCAVCSLQSYTSELIAPCFVGGFAVCVALIVRTFRQSPIIV